MILYIHSSKAGSYNKYNHDDIDTYEPSQDWDDQDIDEPDITHHNHNSRPIHSTPLDNHKESSNTFTKPNEPAILQEQTRNKPIPESNPPSEPSKPSEPLPWKIIFATIMIISIISACILQSNNSNTEAKAKPAEPVPEQPAKAEVPEDPEDSEGPEEREGEPNQEIASPSQQQDTQLIRQENQLGSNRVVAVVGSGPTELSLQLSAQIDRSYQHMIEQWKKKELAGKFTFEDHLQRSEFLMKYESQLHSRELTIMQQKKVYLLEELARNSAEALVFKRTRALFDYFEKKEAFIRYWSVVVMLVLWGLCKLRSIGPKTIPIISFDNYLPWWVPRTVIPNATFVLPIVILLSLIVAVILIFITQGNTIASVLIFSIVGLIVLWSLDATTISSALFCFLRLFAGAILFCVLSSIVFSISYLFPNRGILSRLISCLWIFIFSVTSLVAAGYLGYIVALTDYPHLQTNIEIEALNILDNLIASMDK